jgi:hypothetical protein
VPAWAPVCVKGVPIGCSRFYQRESVLGPLNGRIASAG